MTPIEDLAVLADEQRRTMFAFIRRVRRPVTREEAAADAGISTKLAAFHLDKLVAAGLLRASHESPGGVRKVGRRPKVYELTEVDIRVNIPERRPDLIAEILLDAVLTQRPGEDSRAAAVRVARERGESLGVAERARTRPGRLGPERSLTLSEAMLERTGFEPDRTAPIIGLRLLNCPFHQLVERSTELVCGINHAYLCGFLAGLETNGIEAVLAPAPGQCCVELRTPRAAQVRERADDGGVDQGADGDPDERDRGQQ
ncbi:hypothetical protein AB0J82_05265 [Asanoa sp. NPDC049518]|uniref:helix-turn-helix transcriptional regulator n=1 Tax=unclassified Asanoa TaxID=2685164 RepID=UPI0034311A28